MSIIEFSKLKNIKIISNIIKKSSRVIRNSTIEYNNSRFSADFEEMMIKGYIEMAEINLEYSETGSEYMLDDVNEYEACICGV